jgi:peptide/nickel transport system permease protein
MGGLTRGYVLRRLGMFVITVWLGATMIFIIPRLAPGDPVTAMVQRMLAQAGHVENRGLAEALRPGRPYADPIPALYGEYSHFQPGPLPG